MNIDEAISLASLTVNGRVLILMRDSDFTTGAIVSVAAITPILELKNDIKKAMEVPDLECQRGPKPLPFDMTLKRNRRHHK